jgi:hypothetical protein
MNKIMKLLKKNLFFILTLLLCNNIVFGYKFKFSNVTEKILVVCYKLEGLSREYYQIIPPDQSVSHYFPNAHCFGGSILWAEFKLNNALGQPIPFQGGIDLVDQESGQIPMGEFQELFKSTVANKYAFIPMQIKVVDNETFQMTAQAAQDLMLGVDDLACQTIKTVATFMNPIPSDVIPTSTKKGAPQSPTTTAPKIIEPPLNCRFGLSKIAEGGAGLAGVSLCRDLHFLIVDTGEIGTPSSATKGAPVTSRVKKPILIAEINQGG